MNLRVRFVLWFAVFVAIILSLSFAIIYARSAEFRRLDFFERLRQKALTTHRFLVDVNEIDSTLLKIIDRNTLNTLYGERVAIFNANDRLVYSSIDDDQYQPDYILINRVRREGEVHYSDPKTDYETIGLLVKNDQWQGVVLASAYDLYGYRKMTNLRNILGFTWILGLGLSVLLAYFYVQHIVGRPLNNLTRQIAAIQENNLTSRVEVPANQNELTTLAQNFNELLQRLEQAFETQRNFVQYASHELRTPLANMLSETENMLARDQSTDAYRQTLRSLREEQSRLIELTNSLLLLGRYEKVHLHDNTPAIRIDEVLYNTIEEIKALSPEYQLSLDFAAIPDHEGELMVQGNEALLRSAFRNLIENACRYAVDQTALLHINSRPDILEVWLDNKGPTLGDEESKRLFMPFFRGENAAGKRGHGLGLVIAQRILSVHGARLSYRRLATDMNRFVVNFTKKSF